MGNLYRFVEPVVLLLLKKKGRSYGYDLANDLHAHALTDAAIERAALYRTLRTLEANGNVVSEWETDNSGPARRVYKLTRQGEKHLAGMGCRPGSCCEVNEPLCQSNARFGERSPVHKGPREGATMRAIEPSSAAKRADELFHLGWNCAESVFLAIHEQAGEGEPPVRLLTALGGGMGCKRTCGALSGATVSLGLAYGRTSPDEGARKLASAKANELARGFAGDSTQ
jgi:DNA-binding PadR family transcriptional regulator